MHIKNIMILLVAFICLLISGCGDSSKDQICDFLLDVESENVGIPEEAMRYKRIVIFQAAMSFS